MMWITINHTPYSINRHAYLYKYFRLFLFSLRCILILLNAGEWGSLVGGLSLPSHIYLLGLVKPLAATAHALREKHTSKTVWYDLWDVGKFKYVMFKVAPYELFGCLLLRMKIFKLR